MIMKTNRWVCVCACVGACMHACMCVQELILSGYEIKQMGMCVSMCECVCVCAAADTEWQ